MKRTLLALAAIVAVAIPSHNLRAQADQDIGTLLPENTSVLMMVRDMTTFYELPDDHAVNKLINHDAIQYLFGEMLDELGDTFSKETLDEIGLTEEKLAAWFPGRVIFAGNLDLEMMLDAAAAGDVEGGEANANVGLSMKGISFLAAADTTMTEEELTEFVDNMGKRAVDTGDLAEARSFKDEFEGFPMVRAENKSIDEETGEENWQNLGFILADGMLLIAPMTDDRGQMADHIATDVAQRIKSGGADPGSLAGSRSYIDATDQLADSDLFLFAPLEELAAAGETAIAQLYDDPNKAAGMMMFAQKEALLDFLGLTDFKRLTVAAKIQPDGIETVQELATNERNGFIAKLMNYEQGIQLPEIDPAGLTSVTISGYKLSESLENLLLEIPKLSPMMGGMLNMQLVQMENQGLKIRNGLLPAMGDGITVLTGYATPNPREDQVHSAALIFNATDPAGLAAAMGEVMGFVENTIGGGEVAEPREFMGENIFDADSLAQFLGPMLSTGQESSGAYAIVGDKLIVTSGEKGMIDHVIASMKKGASSLEDHETLAESWKMWGNENLIEFAYSDLASALRAAIYGSEEGVSVSVQVSDDEDLAEAADKADDVTGDMPSLDGLNFSITEKSYDTPEAWVTRVYIAEKPGE